MSPHRADGAARRATALVAVAAISALLLTGCGTRAPESEIRAGSGGGPVTLDESSIAAVKSALPATGTAASSSTATGGAPAAPATVGGAAPSTGVNTPTTPTGGQPAAARPGSPAAPAAVAASCATKGVPVAVGQVGTYSGVTGSISAPGRTALAVWAQDVNARGGLACHPVVVFNRDDGGDPSRAAAEVQDLVNVQKIVALVGSTVAFSVSGFRTAVEAAKVPAIGGELIAPDWNESPWMFPQGASIGDQIVGLIKQSADNGKKKLAYLYCVEVSACTYADKVIQAGAAKRAGAEIVYKSAISITQTDFTAQCQNAKNAGANQLALGMDGSAMIRVARSCSALGYKPVFSGVGGTISPAQATDELLRSFNLATATSAAPWMLSDTPGLKQYQAALARYAPGLAPDGASVSVWTSAALLEKAVSLAGDAARTGPLTTAAVVAGLGKIKNETLGGLTGPLTFKPGQSKATSSACVFYELLTPQGWTAPRGSKTICV
jgi:branched-chain amino acid transport system substrate-binding protein